MIDVLLRTIKKLPDITVDLAYFSGASIHELVDRFGPGIEHRDHGHQTDGDERDEYKSQDELVFYFHFADHCLK
ncbi:hypothetical protein [Pseudomonas asturiensis]|uniref:hypothetical protein n=1 Tax=Pseudomonas asturiensis TaxID=1190415 RepID=UPI001FE50940|nr:hypothetical protein [Pseudomonas asturiensis]